MTTIRPALPQDLEAVTGFLAAELRGVGGASRYRRYLDYTWLHDKPDLGVLLEDRGQVRGFVGAIYSDRHLGATVHRVCNLTSVAVQAGYRNKTLQLFGALLKRKDLTFTCFSASAEVARILDFFKFQHRPANKVIVGPLTGLGGLRAAPRVRVTAGADALDAALEGAERQIARDHRSYRCAQVLVERNDRRCFVVAVRRGRGLRAFADVLYATDRRLLVELLPFLQIPLFRALGTVLTGIDQHWVAGARPLTSVVYTKLRPVYVRSSILTLDDVDALYSELVPSVDP